MNTKVLFDKDVTLNAVLYILEHMNGISNMHKIFKTLYLADQKHLSKYGRTDDIFKAVRGDSYFSAGELKDYFEFINRYTVKPLKHSNIDYLSETDIECLDGAIDFCKDKTFGELTDYTHDFAYRNTARDREMSFKDILREVNDSEDYVNYIASKMDLECSVR